MPKLQTVAYHLRASVSRINSARSVSDTPIVSSKASNCGVSSSGLGMLELPSTAVRWNHVTISHSQSKLVKNQISNINNVSARLEGRGTLNPTCYTMAMDRMCTGISSIRRWAKVEGAQLGEGRTVGGGQ